MRISAVIILLMLLLSGCAQTERQTVMYAMDTEMSIKAYGGTDEALKKTEEEIYRLDYLFRRGSDKSDVYAINENGGAEVSADTAEIIHRAEKISASTDGAFDITIAEVMDLWGFYGQNFRVPDKAELQNAALGYKNAEVSGNYVALHNGCKIDLGGIAKGYAADKAADILKNNGVASAIISLGGNVRAVGKRPDGRAWRVAIQNPDGDGYIGTLDVEDMSVVTSGGYQRFFERDGVVYHHIIDPSTGYPAKNGLKSVSIISADGAMADALSTAIFVMGLEKGMEYQRKNGGFDAVFVTDENKIYITEGIADVFESEYDFIR